MTAVDPIAEVRRLRDEWEATVLAKYENDDTPEWQAHHQAEQDAYDRLIDFVEANGLNYGEYDPRGEKDSL